LSDAHVPYHNKDAQSLVIRWLEDFKPTTLICNGDMIDFYSLSTFDREPSRRFDLAKDVLATQSYLNSLVSAVPSDCTRVYLEGNHCDRLRRWLWRSAPEISQLAGTDIPSILKLTENNWQYLPYHNTAATTGGIPGYNLSNVLLVTHGIFASKYSAYSARAHFERFHTSGISGHSHKLGTYYFQAYGGAWVWLESGCLSTLTPDFMISPNWQNGFVAGYIFHDNANPQDTPRFDMQPVLIHKRKLTFQGQVYRAL
jgi:hypothetical protein